MYEKIVWLQKCSDSGLFFPFCHLKEVQRNKQNTYPPTYEPFHISWTTNLLLQPSFLLMGFRGTLLNDRFHHIPSDVSRTTNPLFEEDGSLLVLQFQRKVAWTDKVHHTATTISYRNQLHHEKNDRQWFESGLFINFLPCTYPSH